MLEYIKDSKNFTPKHSGTNNFSIVMEKKIIDTLIYTIASKKIKCLEIDLIQVVNDVCNKALNL